MAITKKSLISTGSASTASKKSKAKVASPTSAAKLATASRVLAKPLTTTMTTLKTTTRVL